MSSTRGWKKAWTGWTDTRSRRSGGMFDFLDSKAFAAATVAAISAVLCFVSGFGGELGWFIISPLMALVYWLIFR